MRHFSNPFHNLSPLHTIPVIVNSQTTSSYPASILYKLIANIFESKWWKKFRSNVICYLIYIHIGVKWLSTAWSEGGYLTQCDTWQVNLLIEDVLWLRFGNKKRKTHYHCQNNNGQYIKYTDHHHQEIAFYIFLHYSIISLESNIALTLWLIFWKF